jgi:hypothetical protein
LGILRIARKCTREKLGRPFMINMERMVYTLSSREKEKEKEKEKRILK